MKSICFIPARGGSKGVYKKNIRKIAGEPLIAHSIKSAKKSKSNDKQQPANEKKIKSLNKAQSSNLKKESENNDDQVDSIKSDKNVKEHSFKSPDKIGKILMFLLKLFT